MNIHAYTNNKEGRNEKRRPHARSHVRKALTVSLTAPPSPFAHRAMLDRTKAGDVESLVHLFMQLKPMAKGAVERAQLVATETLVPSGAPPQLPKQDLTGRAFFDRKSEEVSEEVCKKRAKALRKLQKQEQKRRRSQPHTASTVDLDALFADQVIQTHASLAVTTNTIDSSGASLMAVSIPSEPAVVAPPGPPQGNALSQLSSSCSSAPSADNGSEAGDGAGLDTRAATKQLLSSTTAASVEASSKLSCSALSTGDSAKCLRLSPSRYVFTRADLSRMHEALCTLVDMTHPAALSLPEAPSPTLRQLRRLVLETDDGQLLSAQGAQAATAGRSVSTAPTRRLCIVEGALEALQPVVLDDVTAAMYVAALLANLSAVPDPILRRGLPVSAMWSTTLMAAQRYMFAKRTLHFLLTVLSNLAYAGRYVTPAAEPEETHASRGGDAASVDEDVAGAAPAPPAPSTPLTLLSSANCKTLLDLGTPYYTEAAVVEAWFVMLCNLIAVHPEATSTFIDLGLVAVAERLLLFHGRQPRVVSHGLQLLSNLSAAVVEPNSSSIPTSHSAEDAVRLSP